MEVKRLDAAFLYSVLEEGARGRVAAEDKASGRSA